MFIVMEKRIKTDIFNVKEAEEKELAKALSVKTEGSTIIDPHGSEPFLVFDRIRSYVSGAWLRILTEHYIFFATTNGTKMHGEIKDWLLGTKTDS